METICDAETFGRFLLQAGWVIGELSPEFKGSIEYITPGNGSGVRLVFDKSFADYDRRLNEAFDEVAAALGNSRAELDDRVFKFLNPGKMTWTGEYRNGHRKIFSGSFNEAADAAQQYGKEMGFALRSLSGFW